MKTGKKLLHLETARLVQCTELVMTHKVENPVRVITSGCNSAVANLTSLVKKTLFRRADELTSEIKDTNDRLDIIDNINESALTDNHVLVSFDVVNIHNKSGLKSVKNVLLDKNFDIYSTQCIVYATEICLTCNNSKFNHQHFLQTDSTAQGLHMSRSFADIALAKYDSLANKFYLDPGLEKDLEMISLHYGNMLLLLSPF